MRRIRTYHEVEAADRSDLVGQVTAQRDRVAARLASVSSVVGVMSGKGGVGKSTVAVGLALALARSGRRVGVLDADLHGPTAARMLRTATGPLEVRDDGVVPAVAADGIRVMSSDLMLADGAALRWREPSGEGFVWRGALETGMLREFLSDVAWGALDVLLVDLPPGTERLDALRQLVANLAGIVIVTIPSEESYRSVRRGAEAARREGIRVLGVIENMAEYRCPCCSTESALFHGNAGERLASDTETSLLARIPFDPRAQDSGGEAALEASASLLSAASVALLARLGPA